MAWNQPSGNGNKDPWGESGGRSQNPPDLDDVLKKIRDAIGGILGGSKGGGSATPPTRTGMGRKGSVLLLIGALLIWIIWGFYIVEPQEQGVVMRFGEFTKLAPPGPHWIARPFYSVEKVDVERINKAEIGFRSSSGGTNPIYNESLMLTEDENIIDIKFAVLYRILEPDRYLFNVLDPDNTLRQATETAVREIVGRSTLDVLTEKRGEVSAEAATLIQSILDRYGEGGAGLFVTSVNMQEAQPPREVQEAFADAVKAREDEERYKNEARAYAADILPKARGDANTVLEQARAYKEQVVASAEGETDRFLKVLTEYEKAPEVTRERLYLETVESVMGNSSKVLMDVEGGNNLLYLPIDQLIKSSSESRARQQTQFSEQSQNEGTSYGDEFVGNQSSSRGRSRE